MMHLTYSYQTKIPVVPFVSLPLNPRSWDGSNLPFDQVGATLSLVFFGMEIVSVAVSSFRLLLFAGLSLLDPVF